MAKKHRTLSIITLAAIAICQPAYAGRSVYQNSIDNAIMQNPTIMVAGQPKEVIKKVRRLQAHGYIKGGRASCTAPNYCVQLMVWPGVLQ